MSGESVHLGFTIEITQADALEYEADILAVKDSPNSGGLDAIVRKRLMAGGLISDKSEHLEVGDYLLVESQPTISHTRYILVVGTPHTFKLDYAQLRILGSRFLEVLWEEGLDIHHLITTVHGVKTGLQLDEVEAFRSLLLGLADAYSAGHYPPTLERITFVERDENRARLLQTALAQFLLTDTALEEPQDFAANFHQSFKDPVSTLKAVIAGPESFEPEFRGPVADETTPHIFVAMPFSDAYDDQFYLAIQPVVNELGFLCERMDLAAFTGDIMERMFDRIRSARFVIALLDGANPNVYLEVGYAWCAGAPTVLLAHHDEKLPFDVRSHRVLIYDKIFRLKDMLRAELLRLSNEGHKSP